MSEVTVQELNFYPIKSFRGLRTSELRLEKKGVQLDRQWMLVDPKGMFITQRVMPELARIGLQLDEGSIELSQGNRSIDFGLEEREGEVLNVTIWKDQVPAYEVSSEVSDWLSEVLSKPVRLVRISDSAERHFTDMPENEIRFVDQKPLLVISRASLDQLELKAEVRLTMSRFRPNIVLSGSAAHAEDTWEGFKIGSLEFKALKACTRCKITAVHPLTGKVGEEPLKTLGTYRRMESGIAFGFYYAHLKEGTIKLGAPVSPH